MIKGWENLTEDDEVTSHLAHYFFLTRPGSLKELEGLLEARGLCQADVVLALLRGGLTTAAGEIAGRAVERLPPAVPPRVPAPVMARGGTSPRVITVRRPNPIRESVPMHGRYEQFKPGRTVEQLLARGLTKRDIRYAVELGHVVIE